jgi:CheY-like chemotaxis protein
MHTYQPAILLVLACEHLRQASHEALTAIGYKVLIAEEGRAALAYLSESEVPPDLIVADTNLRDIRPALLVDAAAKRGKRVMPIASHRFSANGNGPHGGGFNVSTLIARIEDMLAARTARSP